LAAQERKRIRELIRLRRDVEAEKTSAGIWARQAEEEFKHRILLPQSILIFVKLIIILSLLDFVYIAFMCGLKPSALQSHFFTDKIKQDRWLYLVYFSTTYAHLGFIMLMFSYFGKSTVSLSFPLTVSR
jgi:hypothetical protein